MLWPCARVLLGEYTANNDRYICRVKMSNMVIYSMTHLIFTAHYYGSRSSIQCESKNFIPWSFLKFVSWRLRIFKQNFTHLLYVHIYGKLQNYIQLSLNVTELCHIKRNHPVNYFLLRANCTYLSQRMNGNRIHQTSTDLTVSVGCNASGISQTSLEAQDHSRLFRSKNVHCSRSGMTCRRQRWTAL